MATSREIAFRMGDLVDLYDEGGLVCAVVLGEEKGRLKIVTEAGKEMRVTVSRIAHRAGAVSVIPAQAAAAARRHGEAAAARAREIDLPSLWDVLVDEPKRQPLGGLAALALGSDDPLSRSALLRRLHEDRIYFARKGDDFEPRSREHIEEVCKREAAERARAERRAAFLALCRAALAANRSAGAAALPGPEHRETIADLVEVALVGDEAGSRKAAVPLMDEVGVQEGPVAERAFHLLRALGIFQEDENLFIHRFQLKRAFPPEIDQSAERAVAAATGAALAGRRDLRALHAFTIDDEQTTEMDDALSVEASGASLRLGVHIADPGSFVSIGDPVDEEAMSRAATYYFPDCKLPMLPAVVAERAASLVAGEDRPALSFLVTLSPLGEVLDHEIVSSTIRSRARLTYEQADALLGDADAAGETALALRSLRPICDALEAERIGAGAVVIRAAEVEIRVGADGEVLIRRIDERGASRRMVAEAMILANRIAARFCVTRGLPAIYRRQAPPHEEAASAVAQAAPLEPIEADGYDPVAVRALRRRMRRGEVSLAPAPHSGLGLDTYTQATSPIRRYQDLVVHRQIKASLAGRPLPYDAEALARIAATTDEAERAAREAERGTDEYWILKHYERRIGQEVQGVVVASDARRVEVELTDTLYNVHMPARPDWGPGRRVRLTIEAARPRAGRLTLRALDP
ncbi:MAG TPA: RNB domain-containing ribonuclease [Candidatus Polarisedimenticolia bacterium]|jgi:exoribonuclease-2